VLDLLNAGKVCLRIEDLLNGQHYKASIATVFLATLATSLRTSSMHNLLGEFEGPYLCLSQSILSPIDLDSLISLLYSLVVTRVYDKVVLSYDLWTLLTKYLEKLWLLNTQNAHTLTPRLTFFFWLS
jgi:hypothetical protein